MRKQVVFDVNTLALIEEFRKHQTPIPSFSKAVRDMIFLLSVSDYWILMKEKKK